MTGLQRICKIYGGMTVTSGRRTIRYVWDYANDCAVKEADMPFGSERWKASERVRWAGVAPIQSQTGPRP